MVLVMVWFCAVLVEDLQQRLYFFLEPQGQGALGLVLVIGVGRDCAFSARVPRQMYLLAWVFGHYVLAR
jgi:hypothetical protein